MKVIPIIFTVLGLVAASPPFKTKQYRTDYEYNKRTDAFYKLHIETVSYRRASDLCKTEGATLMLPMNKQDLGQVHGMLKQFPDIGEFVWIGNDGQSHESAEEETPIIDSSRHNPENIKIAKGVPFGFEEFPPFIFNAIIRSVSPTSEEQNPALWRCDVLTRDGDIETLNCFRSLPFVCKVEAKDAPYDERCDVYSASYKYIDTMSSCYKVPAEAVTWDEAYAQCRDDGAHLAVLNSEAERQAVKQFLTTAPRLYEAKTTYFYLAGIRANVPTDATPRVFRTVFNETLQEAGFDSWSDGEPNNHQNSEYCGSIFANTGLYNDVNCSDRYGFICEKEVPRT